MKHEITISDHCILTVIELPIGMNAGAAPEMLVA